MMSSSQQSIFNEVNRRNRLKTIYNEYFETSREPLLLVSDHGIILRSNKRFARLSLYSTLELVDQNIDNLFSLTDDSTPLFPLHERMLDRPLLTLNTLMRQKAGTQKPLEIFVCPLYLDDRNQNVYQVLVKENFTPSLDRFSRKTAMNAQWLKSIGALAGGIAHNFNNIMTSLYGNITLAKLEIKDNPKALTYLQKAESSMEEAARLTRELLTFAKGGSPLKEHFNLEPLIRQITSLTLAGSDIQLNLAAPKDLWHIDADRKQLEQVVGNIVMNARHAMAEKGTGTVFIELENFTLSEDNRLPIAKGTYIRITFRDQGCGIPKKSLDRIFDPYYTTKHDSCGMGLSICYSIISRHKGHISAASQTGGGTVVTIYLPAQIHPSQSK
nr:ATP-binding protein [uncultured Desulfobacter sp.]